MLIAIKKHYVKYARIRAFCDPYFTVGPKILSLHEKKGQTKHLFLHILDYASYDMVNSKKVWSLQ